MKKTVTLILIIFSINVNAQGVSSSNLPGGSNGFSGGSNNFLNMKSGAWIKENAKKNIVEGSHYLFDKWNNTAVIYSLDNKGYKLSNINFNVKLNRIEARYGEKKNDSIFVFDKNTVKTININNKKFVKKKIKEGTGNESFFEELNGEGEIRLLKLYLSSIVRGSINPMTQKKIKEDKYVIKSKYYIEIERKGLQEVKLKKSYILKYFNHKTSELKKFIKKNNMKMKNEEDFVKLLNYYNSL